MAFKITPFYNVSGNVGGGFAGTPSDVMLVQYMLFHVCIQPKPNFGNNRGSWTPFAPGGLGPAAIFPYTGIYTRDLDKWIMIFQQVATQRGYGPLTVDGRISRAPVGWGRNNKQKPGNWYTIQALNELMWRFCEIPYGDFHKLSDLPAPLKTEFSTIDIPYM